MLQLPSDQHITYQLQYRKCGKPSCSTCRQGQGHGPSLFATGWCQEYLTCLVVVYYHLSMKQKRAYQYRFYPTSEQEHLLARTFGCVRYIYNWALRMRSDAYYQNQQRIGYHETSAQLTLLKKQTPWLNKVPSVPLQQALSHLDRAFRNFFEGRADYPIFKKRHGQQSASYVALRLIATSSPS